MKRRINSMLAVTDIKIMPDDNTALVQLFADEKTDVTSENVQALVGRTCAMGSSCITADGEVGFLKSNGSWNWIGGDE